jgi:DNA-binding MarR family transcriptional regulator
MAADQVERTAVAVYDGVRLLTRRLRQVRVAGELRPAESAALSRLLAFGPITSADLARAEGISPQSMGATLGQLQELGLVERSRDESDGRRILLGVSAAGREVMERKRDARARQLADALDEGFTPAEVDVLAKAAPLLERLAAALR